MELVIPYPKKCSRCGFKNFKLQGFIHNNELDYYTVNVKCMRCGNPVSLIDSRTIPTITREETIYAQSD